jgi:hypothetical protein
LDPLFLAVGRQHVKVNANIHLKTIIGTPFFTPHVMAVIVTCFVNCYIRGSLEVKRCGKRNALPITALLIVTFRVMNFVAIMKLLLYAVIQMRLWLTRQLQSANIPHQSTWRRESKKETGESQRQV